MKFHNITKNYGKKTVLRSFHLELDNHEVTCLLGPSGCGKTTLMRIGAGLEKIEKGSVTERPKKCSFVFQEDRLLPWYRAVDNMTILGVSKSRALEALDSVGLGKEESSFPDTMSGGMRRRLAIARALAFGGDYYFLDEPCRGLDSTTKAEVLTAIKKMIGNKGALLITHDKDEALVLAHRILVAEGLPLTITKDLPVGGSFEIEKLFQKIHTEDEG